MHNHDENAPKERSSPLVFIPIVLVGVYLIFLAASYAFRLGAEKGQQLAVLAPPKVEEGPKVVEVFDIRQLMKPNADMVSLGSKVFANNCISCHGEKGEGNGSAAGNLAIKPRNFHAPMTEWKNGGSTMHMFNTLEKGLGTMPNFPALNPKQKMAVIQYIHAEFMGGSAPEDTPEMLASIPAPSAGASAKIDPYSQPRVPIEYAIRKLAKDSQTGQSESH